MKNCLVCQNIADDAHWTCLICGEASWSECAPEAPASEPEPAKAASDAPADSSADAPKARGKRR